MHGRMCFVLLAAFIFISGCASKSLLSADCHSCTTEDQEWKEFAWKDLEGFWRGSVENFKNERSSVKKTKEEKNTEIRILPAKVFMQARKVESCSGLPEEALVMNGLLWEGNVSEAKEYEAFVPAEDGKVAYGRVAFEKINNKEVCHFQKYSRVMGKNRLSLPSTNFSYEMKPVRAIASTDGKKPEQEISVEFLRFDPPTAKAVKFSSDNRKPASVKERERPPLMFRVFKITKRFHDGAYTKSEWSATEESIYRFWKVE